METPSTASAAPAETVSTDVKVEGEASSVPASEKTPSEIKVENASKTELPTAQEVKKRIYKIKYGDKEEELDEAEVVRRAQKVTGIEKKAEEAAKQYKVATNLFKLLKESPLEFAKRAKEVGIDPEAMAVEIINAKLKYEQMTPEQRELEQLRQEKLERDRLDKIKAEEEHKRAVEEQTEEYRRSLENEIVEAYKDVRLPKTPWTTARIAAYIDAGLTNGKQYKVRDIANVVKKEYHSMINEVLSQVPEDEILGFLQPEVLETISKARVKKLKPTVEAQKPKAEEKKKEEPPLNPRRSKLIRQYLRRDDHPDA